jgi:hypothetical protein
MRSHILVCLALTLLLAACGPKLTPEATAPPASPTAQPAPTQEPPPEPTPMPPTPTAVPATPAPPPPTATLVPATMTLPPPTGTTAPATTATPPSTAVAAGNSIVGAWLGLDPRDGLYQRFTADGVWLVALTPERLDTAPDAEGIYRLTGDRIILTEVKTTGLPPCNNKTGIYDVRFLSNGNLKFIAVQDGCRGRKSSTAMEHQRIQ